MKLIDLLSVCGDGITVKVFYEEKCIAESNGRDSVPEIFNECEVVGMIPTGDFSEIEFYLRIDIAIDDAFIEHGWRESKPIDMWFKKHATFTGLTYLGFRFYQYGDGQLYIGNDGEFYESYTSIGD